MLLLLVCAVGLIIAQSCAPPAPAKYEPPPEELECGESYPFFVEDMSSPVRVVSGQATGFAVCKKSGLRHRPEARACPTFLPRSKREVLEYIYYRPSSATSYKCTTDEDCSAHPHGYCRYVEPPVGSYCCYVARPMARIRRSRCDVADTGRAAV